MNKKIFPAYSVIEQISIGNLYSFFWHNYKNGYFFPGETHDFWECVYVLRGEICAIADDRVYNMSEGEMVIHKPMEFHKFTISSEDADILIFSFSAEGPLTLALRDKVFHFSESQKGILNELLKYADSKAPQKGEEEDLYLYLHAFSEFPTYGQMVRGHFDRLFLSLIEEGNISPESSSPDALAFREAVNYLSTNIGGQPSLSELSRHCSISEASLKRLFDKYAGVGVHKYFIKMKMRIAAAMLKNGETVSHTAEVLGFSSQSYFSKAYKRETGRNPGSHS
ncbi:MAG: helix-turn-helix domain-containing protein [Ruminococcaceae bacterium]|nr:helix-turn-helix domain-containing protein [Oscillospiraceae bacterium]